MLRLRLRGCAVRCFLGWGDILIPIFLEWRVLFWLIERTVELSIALVLFPYCSLANALEYPCLSAFPPIWRDNNKRHLCALRYEE